jgi:hypothetical protein
MSILDDFANPALTADQAVALVYHQPALCWTAETAWIASRTGHTIVMGGMGIQDMILDVRHPGMRNLIEAVRIAREMPPKTWRGLDVRHVQDGAFEALASLDAASGLLSQEVFDFLTFRDRPGAKCDVGVPLGLVHIKPDNTVSISVDRMLGLDVEQSRLALAFADTLVQEAEPHRHRLPIGTYIMEPVRIDAIDRDLIWDALRIVLSPTGILASFVSESEGFYAPVFWTPEGVTTAQVHTSATAAIAITVMLSALWRDACVVKEEWREQQARRPLEMKRASSSGKPKPGALVLPRKIVHIRWSQRAEREYIERRAHGVRGFYRALTVSETAPAEAADRAQQFGYPPPPIGYTFVRPHTRGRGDGDHEPVRRIVCRGLQSLKIALGI